MKAFGKRAAKHMSRQEAATWAVLAALAFVLVYSWWGATLLQHERQAGSVGGSTLVTNQ